MKTTLILFLVAAASIAQGSVSPKHTKTYQFSFPFKNEVLKVEKTADSYDIAFQLAAQECFDHYRAGQKLSEDQGLDIIDVCANPRS